MKRDWNIKAMRRVRLSMGLGSHYAMSLSCFLLAVLLAIPAYAKGQGPIGLWAATNRLVLLADKSLTGLVLVDLESATATERLIMPNAAPKGVASCLNCNYILISGSEGEFWLLHFKHTISELLRTTGSLGLNDGRLEPLELQHAGGKVTDGRMVLVDEDGKNAFLASSDNHAVFRLNFSATPNAIPILSSKKVKPFGLNWDRHGNILVSMHKKEVWRITTEGNILAKYNIKAADCPGANTLKPNLRAAIDDPINHDSLLILASNPKSYDAVVWRLRTSKQGMQTCTIAAGKIGRNPGWVDASGEDIEFSRPHYFTMRPDSQPFQLIISDIDNRALRLLDLATDSSTTVMYDRDRRLNAIPKTQHRSTAPCTQLKWAHTTPAVSLTSKTSCARPPMEGALQLTLLQAKAHCEAEGARLCEPAELRHTGVSSDRIAWTNASCASCWQRRAREHCASTIATYKTQDMVHGNVAFSQSWNSGHAVEIGASLLSGPATLCRPPSNQLKAAAPCCADEY